MRSAAEHFSVPRSLKRRLFSLDSLIPAQPCCEYSTGPFPQVRLFSSARSLEARLSCSSAHAPQTRLSSSSSLGIPASTTSRRRRSRSRLPQVRTVSLGPFSGPTVLRLTWPVPPVPTVFHAARPPVRRHQDLQHILTKISPISCVLSHCLLPFPLAPPPYPDCIPRTNFPSPACLPPCRAVSWCLFCLLLGAWSVAWPSCLLHPLAHAPPSRLSSSQPSFSCCHLRAPFVLVASSTVFLSASHGTNIVNHAAFLLGRMLPTVARSYAAFANSQ